MDKGLFVVAKLGTSDDGENAFADYEEGIIREHSIGFKYISDKINFIADEGMDEGGYFEINEVALWEFSAVTFGANQYTGVIDVAKGQERKDMAVKLMTDIELVQKSIISGQGTDERLYALEMRLKYLNARMLDLAITEPTIKSHSAEIGGEIISTFDWNKVANNY